MFEWENSGLLDGLSDFDKKLLTYKLNLVIEELLPNESLYTKLTVSLIFPLIRRVYTGGMEDSSKFFKHLDSLHLLSTFNQYTIDKSILLEDLRNVSYNGIDAEAELCAIYSEQYYYDNFKKSIEPLKFIKKHRL